MSSSKNLFTIFRYLFIIFTFSLSNLMATDILIKISLEEFKNASLLIRNEMEILSEQEDQLLVRCSLVTQERLDENSSHYNVIESYDYLLREDLSPKSNGGIPIGVVVDRGSQGVGGWHQGVAMAGPVLAYRETDVDGQLPGFTFWDMEKDSTWHHYIDTDLDGDEPLFMAASENKIYYTFHFSNPVISNSDMRYYWYDVQTDEHGEVENFGYGFEGFGVSDKWMMRVGSKGSGWNNQILAHNLETGLRFEMLADSTVSSWGYNYDNFGGPRTDGNTIVYKYTDNATYTPELKVRSLGADGEYGTADDIVGTIANTAANYGQYKVSGRYIVWVEGTDIDEGNILAYDMGEDELYGTADDGSVMDICSNPYQQATVRIEGDIILWEDWRNVTNTSSDGEHDIYGYDLKTATEFRSTPTPDVMQMVDFHRGEAIMVKKDWDESNNYNDIYFANIYGRIQSDYYRIDIMNGGNPQSISYLNSDLANAPYSFENIIRAAKGPLGAIFIKDQPFGQDVIMSYSAVTGDWDSELISFPALDYTCMMNGDNGLIIGIKNTGYETWTFNGATGSFSSRYINGLRPTGFSVGKNISFVWGDDSTYHWIKTYDAVNDNWSFRTATTNNPWHVIHTEFSDSLGLLLYGQGDSLCTNVGLEVYDLELHDWVALDYTFSHLRELNRRTYKDELIIKTNNHLAVAAHEYDYLYDYIYTYSTGDDAWKVKTISSSLDLDKPLLGENFIVQACRYDDVWQAYIYNNISGEWLDEYIDARAGIDDLRLFDNLMIAWKENQPWNATVWAYSLQADGIQTLTIPYPGNDFAVEAASKAGYVYAKSKNFNVNHIHVFNGFRGEWSAPLPIYPSQQYSFDVSGHTGLFLNWVGSFNGFAKWKAYGYSALKDQWDVLEFMTNDVDGIFSSDYCGLLSYDHYYNSTEKHFHAFNGIEAKWSEDIVTMYKAKLADIQMNDRIMMLLEDGSKVDNYAKAHMFSPFLDRWNTTIFTNSYAFEGYYSTPTSVFAWDGHEFKIIFSDEITWTSKPGRLDELHVTDYAITASLYYGNQTNIYHFYPPKTEIVNDFELTEGPNMNVKSSWAVEVAWKTNLHSDTRLIWGFDGYYSIIEQDTLTDDYTKDHRVLIEGLEANKTYYYALASAIAGVDTVMSDTLIFVTGVDTDPPVLVAAPTDYRIHDHEASVWWETDEPSTAIIQWGLTRAYTDTLEFPNADPFIMNAVRMYDLLKDTSYHYRVGGYDRYGNGPFFSGDYTFRTENILPLVTDLAQADSTLYGAAYMTWEPPRLDSLMDKETFNNGIPVDWKIYNLGDNHRGTSWRSGYSGNNPVAYCSYGSAGECQEEWLITNPITINGKSGGVLNFWHTGFYTDYDNAPNKVMISYTGTDRSNFTTIWSSQTLPTDWQLVQLDLNFSANYGKTFYLAFVYESTYGEIWMLDNIYMDWRIDGYYENFDADNDFWNNWTKAPMPSRFGLKFFDGNYCIGVDSYDEAPDSYQEEDSWMFSPFITISESHHILGFWQNGCWSAMDNAPNEIRIAYSKSIDELASNIVKSIYPIPEGWQWTTVDLSSYIGQSVRIAFRYHSYAGWLWNGLDWSDWYGETWYIDDMYLFENVPTMIVDPNAKPNEKPMKFASSPDGNAIRLVGFSKVVASEIEQENMKSGSPQVSTAMPKEKPLKARILPQLNRKALPSEFGEIHPVLLGYEVYGRFLNGIYYEYLGYVKSPSFVDWNTYLGQEREYYVEAVYDQGNAQPSNKKTIKGGIGLKSNEYAYDSGTLFYSYWWYPGMGFANKFYFEDSALTVEKIKVHIAQPGNFKVSLFLLSADTYYTVFTSKIVIASEEGWYTIDIPTSANVPSSSEIYAEFYPQDTLVQISYEPTEVEAGGNYIGNIYNGTSWSWTSDVFYIRLIGSMGPKIVAVTDVPQEFKLAQNYPNPFNPITSIEFELPEAKELSLKVYDIRGSLVATLAEGHREAGKYQVVWNAKNMKGVPMASGVYLLKMTAGEFSSIKKMTLLR